MCGLNKCRKCACGHCCVMVFPPSSFSNTAQITFAGVTTPTNTVVSQISPETNLEAQSASELLTIKEPKRSRKSNGAKST